MKKLLGIIIIVAAIAACKKEPGFNGGNYDLKGGVFLVNEGNFRAGNGSLSFWSYDSLAIYNDLFQSVNGRPLGDVPFSMITKDDKAYIIVNNSGKIEVINNGTLKSVGTINGLISPRYMAFVNSTKAYVTSLYSDSIAIIDIATNDITGYVNLRRTSESILVAGNKAYISNWVSGHEVMIVNTLTNKVVDSIDVGIEPESMVRDMNNKLWVLCTGGYSGTESGKLVEINISNDSKVFEFAFPAGAYPTNLIIDSYGQNLYYLEGGLKKMNIYTGKLPGSALIPQPAGATFYKAAINPSNGDLFITDAVDYTGTGFLWIYENDGTFSKKETAGIIPGGMCFKLRY